MGDRIPIRLYYVPTRLAASTRLYYIYTIIYYTDAYYPHTRPSIIQRLPVQTQIMRLSTGFVF